MEFVQLALRLLGAAILRDLGNHVGNVELFVRDVGHLRFVMGEADCALAAADLALVERDVLLDLVDQCVEPLRLSVGLRVLDVPLGWDGVLFYHVGLVQNRGIADILIEESRRLAESVFHEDRDNFLHHLLWRELSGSVSSLHPSWKVGDCSHVDRRLIQHVLVHEAELIRLALGLLTEHYELGSRLLFAFFERHFWLLVAEGRLGHLVGFALDVRDFQALVFLLRIQN